MLQCCFQCLGLPPFEVRNVQTGRAESENDDCHEMQPEAMRKRKGRFPWINLSAFDTRTLTRAIDNDKATNAMHVVAMMMERNT